MEFVYLDQELNSNNNPTGSYRISIDKNRKFSWENNPNKFCQFHRIKVLVAQETKTSLLGKLKQSRIEHNTVRDCLELSLSRADEVKILMDDYEDEVKMLMNDEEEQPLSYIQYESSSDPGCITIIVIAVFALILSISIFNKDNFATTNQSNEGSTSPSKYEGTIDASPLGYQSANVRSKPYEGSARIKTLNNGTKIFFSRTSKGWVHVILDNGSEGWIASNLVKNKRKKLN